MSSDSLPFLGPSHPSARPRGVLKNLQSSFPYRYSGAHRNYGDTPTGNSLVITVSGASITNPYNHVDAWQGIGGDAECPAGSSVVCNWVQAGISLGIGCYGVGSSTSLYLYVEINYYSSVDCPPGGAGYYIADLGTVAFGSAHTIIAYNCQTSPQCVYSDGCWPFSNWSSDYGRAAIRVDGCMRASNVFVDAPRQIEGTAEDYYGNSNGDSILALFRSSSNPFYVFEFGPVNCSGYTDGTHRNWNGCMGAN